MRGKFYFWFQNKKTKKVYFKHTVMAGTWVHVGERWYKLPDKKVVA